MFDVVGKVIDDHKVVILQFGFSCSTVEEVIDDHKTVISQYWCSHLVVIWSSGL